MSVLAVDPSLTRTGVTLGDGFDYEVTSLSTDLKGVARLIFYRDHILHKIEYHRPRLVVYEGYAMGFGRGVGRFFDLGELGGVLKTAIYESGTDMLIVPPTCLKKFMTGKGNADKEEVRKAAAKHRGKLFRNLDESDAYGLYIMGLACLDPRYLPRRKGSPQHAALGACDYLKGKKTAI